MIHYCYYLLGTRFRLFISGNDPYHLAHAFINRHTFSLHNAKSLLEILFSLHAREASIRASARIKNIFSQLNVVELILVFLR